MKKILLIVLATMCLLSIAFADRDVATSTGYTANTLIKIGDAKVYSVDYVVTTAGGYFGIYDTATTTEGSFSNSTIKTEGSEAVALNGKHLDFTDKPLEFSTGLYLVVKNCSVIVRYE